MAKIGCIVMYSKPIDNNRTIPCGTVYYSDGTKEELSLREAAEKALDMQLEYGYDNALENERYFNVTYEDFLENHEKYVSIAKSAETKTTSEPQPEPVAEPVAEPVVEPQPEPEPVQEPEQTSDVSFSVEPEPTKIAEPVVVTNLPENIVQVEPPKVVKAEPEKDNSLQALIDSKLKDIKTNSEEEENELNKMIQSHQSEEQVSDHQLVIDPENIDFEELKNNLDRMLDKNGTNKPVVEKPTEDDLFKLIENRNKEVEAQNKKMR